MAEFDKHEVTRIEILTVDGSLHTFDLNECDVIEKVETTLFKTDKEDVEFSKVHIVAIKRIKGEK